MKKSMFFIVFLFVFTITQAQITCIEDALAAANKEALYSPYKGFDYSPFSFCIKTYVHLIRKSDGTGGQSVSDVYQALSFYLSLNR